MLLSDRTLRYHVAKKHPGKRIGKPGRNVTLTDKERKDRRKALDKAAWARRKARLAQKKKEKDADCALLFGENKPQGKKAAPDE